MAPSVYETGDTATGDSSKAVGDSEQINRGANARTPVCLVVGMAGSGKTTLVDALAMFFEDDDEDGSADNSRSKASALEGAEGLLQDGDSAPAAVSSNASNPQKADTEESETKADQEEVASEGEPGAYVVNLDPAVLHLPYEPNIDIRDTIKYKDVMREYSLGPNGAIITSLNLFATRFDQVLSLVERRAPASRAVLIDTPGQIETFTWSASGTIITDALAMALPTVVLYVIDTPRCSSAMTFVSNMLYACSIMYKTRLPMIIVFNKSDVCSSAFAEAWMRDFDAFDAALNEANFAGTLARSMARALEEFYTVMRCVTVSAVAETGFDDLAVAVREAVAEYEREYEPQLKRRKEARAQEERTRQDSQIERLRNDLEVERQPPGAVTGTSPDVADRQERDTAWSPDVPSGTAAATSDAVADDFRDPGSGSRRMHAIRDQMRKEKAAARAPASSATPRQGRRVMLLDPEEEEGGASRNLEDDARAYEEMVRRLERMHSDPGSDPPA